MPPGAASHPLTREKLARCRKAYVDDWLVPMWPKLDWRKVHEFVFWHAVAGWARGSNAAADHALAAARAGRAGTLGTRSRELWADLQARSPLALCHTDPLALLSTPDVLAALTGLDEVKHIGPKIAAFTLRDLSFLRDARDGGSRWFGTLPEAWQAAFTPIDRHVYAALLEADASPTAAGARNLSEIQNNRDTHYAVSLELVCWARQRGFDPRDVNVFWFSYGAGDVDEEGRPTPDEGRPCPGDRSESEPGPT
jgi:hypothetical protein